MSLIRYHIPSRSLAVSLALITALLIPSAVADLTPIGGYTVRCAYVIPTDRDPAPDGVKNFKEYMTRCRAWYAQQMWQHGYGAVQFRMETEADGFTPIINVIEVPRTAAQLRGSGGYDLYFNTYDAVIAAGYSIPGDEIWFMIPETHVLNPDSTLDGSLALGGGNAAMCGSDILALSPEDNMCDDQPYDGTIYPPLGPYQMIYETTYVWFVGDSLGSLTSCWVGAVIHELGHAFELNHNFQNDRNMEGNVMGHGLRGFRGWEHPDLYPDYYCRLSYPAAKQLSFSPYFTTPPNVPNSYSAPSLTVHTSGAVTPTDGVVEISFTAADPDGLSYAILYRGGDIDGEMELSGTSATATFVTDSWEPGNITYYISLWDVYGNRLHPQSQSINLTFPSGYNQAPRPTIMVRPSIAQVGEQIELNAEWTWDDDYWGTRYYEWDLDNDGVYDIGPTSSRWSYTSYDEPGFYTIRLRVTDLDGGQSVSARMLIEVREVYATGDLNCDEIIDVFDIDPFVTALVNEAQYALDYPGCDRDLADCNNDGTVDVFDIDPFVAVLVGAN